MRLDLAFVALCLMTGCTQPRKSNSGNASTSQADALQNNDNHRPAAQPLGLPPPRTIVGGRLNEKATKLPQPIYPKLSKSLNSGGEVAVQVLVDETGHVVSATVVSGNQRLRAAAVQAARQAEFEPFIINGEAKTFSGVITYSFKP